VLDSVSDGEVVLFVIGFTCFMLDRLDLFQVRSVRLRTRDTNVNMTPGTTLVSIQKTRRLAATISIATPEHKYLSDSWS
jgi:hypothetical protein